MARVSPGRGFRVRDHVDHGGRHRAAGQGYIDKGIRYRVVWLDHPDGPIGIISVTTGPDLSWFETVEDVIDTFEFG